MTISFIEAQRLLGEATGSYRLFTTSGAGTTSTIVSTELQEYYIVNTSVPTAWVRIRSGVEVGQIRRLDGSYTFSTGTIKPTRNFANAVGDSVDFELWTINPTEIILAIKRAVAKLYPVVSRRLVDTSIIVNNILDNPTFDNPDPRTVLSFDGAGDADDLVTVTDDSSIQNVWGTGGAIEIEMTLFSHGEGSLGNIYNKVGTVILSRDEQLGFCRIQITVKYDTNDGVWLTTDRCWELSVPHVLSIRHNTDDVANDPELFIDGVRREILATGHPSGTRTSDSGSDLIFGNIAAAIRTIDGNLSWIRIWDNWRSDREIRENISTVLTGHEIGLIGLWVFDLGSGSTIYDLSVSQNNGAITSATWTTEFPHWAQANSPAVTRDRDRTFHGNHSARVVSGSSAGQLTQIPQINIALRAENSITAKAWAWTNAGTQARLRLDFDGGTTFENGDYHDGRSEWQLLTVTGTIPTSGTVVKIILETIASQIANWGYAWLDVGAKAEYPVPDVFETLNYVSQQADENIPDGVYTSFADWQNPTTGRLLKLEGKGRVPVPVDPNDLMDLNDKQIEYLTALSTMELYQTLQARVEGTKKDEFIVERDTWVATADGLSRDRGVRSPSMSAEVSKAWHLERNGNEMTLVFDNNGGGGNRFTANIG